MQEYNNQLDQWYYGSHWIIQKGLAWPYQKISEILRWATGDPNKLAAQCGTYQEVASQVERMVQEFREAAVGISGWEGQAHSQFLVTVGRIQESLSKIAPAIAKTQEVLRSAAETCVEVANTIIDLFKSLIEFIIASAVVSAALSILTLGASIAAEVAAILAKGLQTLAKVVKVVERMAKVLMKLAELLTKLVEILKKIAEFLRAIKEILKLIKELKKGATLVEKALLTGVKSLITFPINKGANAVLDGVGAPFRMPSGVGELREAGKHGGDALDSSQDAVDSATGVPGR